MGDKTIASKSSHLEYVEPSKLSAELENVDSEYSSFCESWESSAPTEWLLKNQSITVKVRFYNIVN